MKKPIKLTSYLIPRLRKISLGWPSKTAARNLAKKYIDDGTYLNGNVKTAVRFECAVCARQGLKELHKQEDTHMDHINPVVGMEGFTDWNTYIPALFCELENYECLCIEHHKQKTAKENIGRYNNKIKIIREKKPNTIKFEKLSRKKTIKKQRK